jgi:hypothetical protein
VLFFKPIRFQLNMSKHNDYCFEPPEGRRFESFRAHHIQTKGVHVAVQDLGPFGFYSLGYWALLNLP